MTTMRQNFLIPTIAAAEETNNVIYRGFRPRDSLEMNESFKKEFYGFDYPSYTNLKPTSVNDVQ